MSPEEEKRKKRKKRKKNDAERLQFGEASLFTTSNDAERRCVYQNVEGKSRV